MLEFDGLNWLAVVVVWLIFCALGAFWYSPKGFASTWKQETDIDIMALPGNEANTALGAVVIASAIQAIVLGLVLNTMGASSFGDGLVAGLVISIGLTVASTVGTTLYQRRSWNFLVINGAFFVIAFTIGSVIFAIW